MPPDSSFSVRYTSTRSEIWRWYWRAWAKPRGLWLFHVLIAVAAAASVSMPGTATFDADRFIRVAVSVGLACVVLLPLWPQLSFKRQERLLTIDAAGWSTRVGQVSGSRRWADVRSISDTAEGVIITGKNRNALIVPNRAFSDAAARLQFLSAAREWHSAS
jgi:hypothetical protein